LAKLNGMNAALRAMLEGVIDYAGLFPPARLPVSEGVEEYLGIIQGPDKWIVDRFACPIGKLQDLAVELTEHPEEPFVPVAVIGGNHADHKHWKHGIEHDAAEMARFQAAVENHAEIQAYEVRLPDHRHLAEYVAELKAFANIDVFAELAWAPQMSDSLAVLAEMDFAYAKARTGGLEANAFPSGSELGGFIQQCVHLDLGFKLTAGLHHALPTLDSATGATMHGFLNVLAATSLGLSEDLSKRELEELLNETDPKALTFKRDTLVWRDHKASQGDIENARALFFSFGSCSVREPVQELSEMGLLEKASR
jgi:hypothetical protein